jgi:transcriptional regulator with XRE-family HTH domain
MDKPALTKHDRVAALLRKLRLEAGLRQVDVAKRLRLPQSFVSKYENGERRLEFVEVAETCAALGVRFSEFVRRFEAGG